jgi:hypothetical protein
MTIDTTILSKNSAVSSRNYAITNNTVSTKGILLNLIINLLLPSEKDYYLFRITAIVKLSFPIRKQYYNLFHKTKNT